MLTKEKTRLAAGPFDKGNASLWIAAISGCSFCGSSCVRLSAAALLCWQPAEQHCHLTKRRPEGQEGSHQQYRFHELCFAALPPAHRRVTVFLALQRAACRSSRCRWLERYMKLRCFLAFWRRQQRAAMRKLKELFFSCQHPSFFDCCNLNNFTQESIYPFGVVQKYLEKNRKLISIFPYWCVLSVNWRKQAC